MAVLDLRGVPCPLNFVRTKLALEQLAVGDRLDVWIDAGEPVQQVPSSLTVCGHQVLELAEQAEGHYLLCAQRGTPQESSDG